jgi:hypothetical protein
MKKYKHIFNSLKGKIFTIINQLLLLLIFSTAAADAATYYIDSANGKDTYSGTQPDSAWMSLAKVNSKQFLPGDKILFKANGIWNGQLSPKGSGQNGEVIQIDMYGEGNKPIFNGRGEVTNTVYLYNQEYWEISNLEITNFKNNDTRLKRGVYIFAENVGTLHHIHLKNLFINDVNGDMSTKHNGGIFFEVKGNSLKTRFDDFLIEGCQIVDVDRTGISNLSSWWDRTLNNDDEWYPSTNVVIRNNWIENTGANGLIIRVAVKPLIEHNVFKHCSLKGSGNAMFPFNCDDALFQYNEAYLTVFNTGDDDAGGFDSDWQCKRTIYQYNYSHDNDYGFVLICCNGNSGFNDGTIIRYNISQNDNGFIFKTSGPATNTRIHNNTIFVSPTMKNEKLDHKDNGVPKICYHKSWNGYSDNTFYFNNIIYNLSQRAVYDFGQSTKNKFDYNVFFGEHPSTEPSDLNKILDDPHLIDPGSGTLGLDSLGGYMLGAESPAIDCGLEPENNCDQDFWRNPIPSGSGIDRGAHEFSEGAGLNENPSNDELVEKYSLCQNYPNPFNSRTKILVSLSNTLFVDLSIFNLLGENIKILSKENLPGGQHEFVWDCENEKGETVSSGIYFCRLKTDESSRFIKMVFAR